jgi:drug/metabolite transporter (DMT)-like permease
VSSISQAALWMAGWLTATLAMTVAGRELGRDIPVFVLMLLRSLIATAILAPIVLAQGDVPARLRQLRLHVVRNLIHYGAQYAWFSALLLIPLAEVISIEFTTPMWVAILAALFLGERLDAAKVAAIALGFLGILMIVRPGISTAGLGHVLALAAALGFGCAISFTKFISRRDSPLTIIFLMFAIQSVIGAVPAFLTWKWPESQSWLLVAVVGLTGTFSHFCLSKALSLADASLVMPMDFLRVPLTALIGYWLYREGLDAYSILGAALILAANTVNLARARGQA